MLHKDFISIKGPSAYHFQSEAVLKPWKVWTKDLLAFIFAALLNKLLLVCYTFKLYYLHFQINFG